MNTIELKLAQCSDTIRSGVDVGFYVEYMETNSIKGLLYPSTGYILLSIQHKHLKGKSKTLYFGVACSAFLGTNFEIQKEK
jgi:hypothetical protein